MGACSSKSTNQVAQISPPIMADTKNLTAVSVCGDVDGCPTLLFSNQPTTHKTNLSSDLASLASVTSLELMQSPRVLVVPRENQNSSRQRSSSEQDQTESTPNDSAQNSFDSMLPNAVFPPPHSAPGLFIETSSPTASARARVQYPSERELSIHRENSIKSMRKRAASLSLAAEENDEEEDMDPDTSIDRGNNANVRLHSSLKNNLKSPLHRRKLSISTNNAHMGLGQIENRDCPSPCEMPRLSMDLLSPTAPTVPHAFSPRRSVESPLTPHRALGLNRHDSTDNLHPKKKEISLAQQLLQKQLSVEQHSKGVDAQPQDHNDDAHDCPSPHRFDLNSPFLSFRRLPSRSRQNSISISGTPATAAPPSSQTPTCPKEDVPQGSTPAPSTPKGSPVDSTTAKADYESKHTLDSPRVAKVEWLWSHYAGRDAKTLGKKGLLQLAEDVFKEFCRRYKDRMMEIKRTKNEELQSKKGKVSPEYSETDAERDLRADLPLLLPATASKPGCEPEATDYVKYVCKFLYAELTKIASNGLTSFGKGHKRSTSLQRNETSSGTGSFRARANSFSINTDAGLQSFANRLAAGDGALSSGLESFSSSSQVVKISKMEFILGWKRTQDALFQAIDRIKSSADSGDSACKLM